MSVLISAAGTLLFMLNWKQPQYAWRTALTFMVLHGMPIDRGVIRRVELGLAALVEMVLTQLRPVASGRRRVLPHQQCLALADRFSLKASGGCFPPAAGGLAAPLPA